MDKNVPTIYRRKIKKSLKKYKVIFYNFNANEKSKSFSTVSYFLNKLLTENLTRSDLIISIGGGITGDLVKLCC